MPTPLLSRTKEHLQDRLWDLSDWLEDTCWSLYKLISFPAAKYYAYAYKRSGRRMGIAPSLTPRGRALSVDVPREERTLKRGVVRRKMEGQVQAGWFGLPFEIREMVYRVYFEEGEDVVVAVVAGVFGAFVSWRGDEDGAMVVSGLWGVKRKVSVLPLLMSCRRVYLEAVSYMYSCPTFFFVDMESLLVFSHSVLPVRFNAIRSVRLQILTSALPPYGLMFREHYPSPPALGTPTSYIALHSLKSKTFYGNPSYENHLASSFTFWQTTCHTLARMESLTSLDILIHEGHIHSSVEITKPLERLRLVHLKKFALRVAADVPYKPGQVYPDELPVEEWKLVVKDGGLLDWDVGSFNDGNSA